jgi:ribosome-binding protein aMBF1 (putative translation factor)
MSRIFDKSTFKDIAKRRIEKIQRIRDELKELENNPQADEEEKRLLQGYKEYLEKKHEKEDYFFNSDNGMSWGYMQMSIQDSISEALSEMNMPQKKLAELTEISQSVISGYKNGEQIPSVFNFAKICVVLGLSADKLLGLKNEYEDG